MAVHDFDGFTKAIDGFYDSMTNMQSLFIPYGQTLLASLAFLMLVWVGLQSYLTGGGGRKMLGKAIGLILNYAIAALLLNNILVVGSVLERTVDDLGSKVTKGSLMGSVGGPKPSDTIMQAVTPIFQASIKVMEGSTPGTDSESKTQEGANNKAKEVGYSAIYSILANLQRSIVYWIISAVLKLLIVFAFMVTGLIAACQFLISQVLIKLALLMAPIMIPFMIWSAADWVFDGWVRFVIKAFMHKLVGIVILTILTQGITGSLKSIGAGSVIDWSDGDAFRISALIAMLGIAFLGVYLANLIPAIADGLLGGAAAHGKPIGKSIEKQAAALMA